LGWGPPSALTPPGGVRPRWRRERIGGAHAVMNRRGRNPGTAGLNADRLEERAMGRESKTGAWRWSRGADVAALVLFLGVLGGGANLYVDGYVAWGVIAMASAGLLMVGLIVHAATSGRRFGRR